MIEDINKACKIIIDAIDILHGKYAWIDKPGNKPIKLTYQICCGPYSTQQILIQNVMDGDYLSINNKSYVWGVKFQSELQLSIFSCLMEVYYTQAIQLVKVTQHIPLNTIITMLMMDQLSNQLTRPSWNKIYKLIN